MQSLHEDRYIGQINLFLKNGKFVASVLGAYGYQAQSTSKVSAAKAIELLVQKTAFLSCSIPLQGSR